MARGIEELAEMQVTGPVQGGDMVMKPDQAPVGAAALLNKMSRQNTPGIFKLPMPDKQMPDFMKVAAEGVEQQTAKGDSINQMAGELMRQGINIQGMGMDEIIQIYEQTFGSPGDVDEFGVSKIDPSDWRTIIKILEAGGDPGTETQMTNLWQTWQKIKDRAGEDAANDWLSAQEAQAASLKFPGNFTSKDQDVTELPRNLRTAPDAEETELAYITNDEKAILALMNPGTPHEGPEGVPSYDSYDYGVQTTSGDWADYETGGGDAPTAYTQARDRAATDKDYATQVTGSQTAGDQMQQQAAAEIAQETIQGGGKMEDYEKGQQSGLGDIIRTGMEKGWDFTKGLPVMAFKAIDALSGAAQDFEIKQVKKLLGTLGTEDAATGWGNLLRSMQDQSTGKLNRKGQDWFDDRGDLADEILGDPSKDNEWAGMDDEEKFQYMIDKMEKGGGKQFQKNYDPNTYYERKGKESTADYQRRMRKEGKYDPKEMAQLQAEGKLDFNRSNTAMIEAGRRQLEEDRQGGTVRRSGTGIPVEKITEEEEVVTTTDPRAGAWNVGGTMPYTEDIRTAGVETDVPLGRRFGIDKAGKYAPTGRDLSKAMEYATLGGYSQLEPFQEYLTRRREHLGEDEPVYFDEDGNVIYSGVT
jgi:hypothetical protein